MTTQTPPDYSALRQYACTIEPDETPAQTALRAHTLAHHPYHEMQILPEQGALLAWLVKAFAVEIIVEVGVFTGYSALTMAQALPRSGRIIACDKNEDWVAMALPFWQQAGVADRIELRIGWGEQTLNTLIDEGLTNQVDMLFIDADKTNYPIYYEQALTLLRPGGLLVLDNVFLMGRVLTDAPEKKTAKAIRALNLKIKEDVRVDPVVLPIADGMTLVRKR